MPGNSQGFGYVRESSKIQQVNLRRKEMRLIEAFSGAGGMHLGYKAEGFEMAMAIEMNEAAVKTFQLNNPKVPVYADDVNKFIEKYEKDPQYQKLVGHVDAVHASSPCQGFSKANRNGGQNDDRNNELSYSFVNLLRITNAKVGVFENVEGMWTVKGMPYLRKLLVGCLGLGYQVRVQILRACDYGDPQKRPRLIIFAAKNHVLMPDRPHRTHGPKARPYVTTKDALGFLLTQPKGRYKNMEAIETKAKYTPGEHGCEKLNPNKLAPAVLASGPPVLHYAENRLLNVRETAALQSFPLDYEFCGTQKEQKKQAGNAVPVKFSGALARAARDSLRLYYVDELSEDSKDDTVQTAQSAQQDCLMAMQVDDEDMGVDPTQKQDKRVEQVQSQDGDGMMEQEEAEPLSEEVENTTVEEKEREDINMASE